MDVTEARATLAEMRDYMADHGQTVAGILVHPSQVPLMVAAGCTDPEPTGTGGEVRLTLPADL